MAVVAGEAIAQNVYDKENRLLAYVYQQREYKLFDQEGDFLLIWSSTQIPYYVMNTIKGKQIEFRAEKALKIDALAEKYPDFAPKEDQKNVVVAEYVNYRKSDFPIAIQGNVAPFIVKNLSLMMEEVITEELKNGIHPTLGVVHKWSNQGPGTFRRRLLKIGHVSKLLLALARGVTSKYLVAGKEKDLKDYLISRPTESVTLQEIFRTSYKMNNGDMYLSLLTIENVLSEFWTSPDRDKRLITTKLKDIINFNYKTDKFGSWYHLFGIMLYGYAEGGSRSFLVGKTETVGGAVMSRFKEHEWQEEYINAHGGKVGSKLHDFVKKKKYEKFEINSQYTEENFYLKLDEDFTDDIAKVRSGS